jgi:hypothetical protein
MYITVWHLNVGREAVQAAMCHQSKAWKGNLGGLRSQPPELYLANGKTTFYVRIFGEGCSIKLDRKLCLRNRKIQN